ncbi:MAG: hypothetical protein ACREOK_10595 [Gemmatimonadaceae bacterium]
MNRLITLATAAALLTIVQDAQAQDESRKVEGGGIQVEGWQGKIDAREAQRGLALDNAKLSRSGNTFQVTTGPAVSYWHPDNKATGNYTVKASFTEPKFQNLNNHPHPYGIFIAGNELGTDQQSYLYCSAYGSGKFIVRGFGPQPFQMNGRGETSDAVNKAAAQGESVTQEIALSVKDDSVDCSINGKVVASYPKSAVVGEGKLTSTDGVYGIRFGHNTEATVSGLAITKP